MIRHLVFVTVVCALAACSKKAEKKVQQETPAPPPAVAPGPAAPAPVPAGFAKTDLGAVSTGTASADDSRLVIDGKGRPVVAYKSANKHYVRRWDAGAWTSVGDAVACKSELSKYALATDSDGSVLVAGTIMNAKGSHVTLACVARETAEGWKMVGQPLGDEQTEANGIAMAVTAAGPTVILRQRRGDADTLAIWRFDGSAWKPVGDGKVPATAGTTVPELAIVDAGVTGSASAYGGFSKAELSGKLAAASDSGFETTDYTGAQYSNGLGAAGVWNNK